MSTIRWTLAVVGLTCSWAHTARANGGPFVVKYPGGDPAAKGVLARIGPDLKPGHETWLRVVKEDLTMIFEKNLGLGIDDPNSPPLVRVLADYTIENPMDDRIEVDFGFPILRGIFVSPYSMAPVPEVRVKVDGRPIPCVILSNSVLYGMIRQQARSAIEKALTEDQTLRDLAASLRAAKDKQIEQARQSLHSYLAEGLKWNPRDAVLLEEYVCLDLGGQPVVSTYMGLLWIGPSGQDNRDLIEIATANLGPLAAIGDQKATQFIAHLAGLLSPEACASYEELFKAWGGDVRELALDTQNGTIRPRLFSLNAADPAAVRKAGMYDPTVYARVDYLDTKARLSDAQRAACKAILKHLPVVFTFAPMNLLHYRPAFEPRTTYTLQVEYRQYAYADTQEPQSFQVAYVVHPASFWNEFGPIHLKVSVPQGVHVRASVPLSSDQTGSPTLYHSTLTDKTGELYVAVDAIQWKTSTATPPKTTAALTHQEVKIP